MDSTADDAREKAGLREDGEGQIFAESIGKLVTESTQTDWAGADSKQTRINKSSEKSQVTEITSPIFPV